MATYIIGDVQGCYDQLQALLAQIDYQPTQDTLWFAGDLVNRGPKSLEVLRFVSQQVNCHAVLGNHDLHLLASVDGHYHNPKNTLGELLEAPDRDTLLNWLIQQPLCHYNAEQNWLLSHAGIYPGWEIEDCLAYSQEVSKALQDDTKTFAQHIPGNMPNRWQPDLAGYDRLRMIINAFTRMRFISADKTLDFSQHGAPGTQPDGLIPWFEHPEHRCEATVVFGHWSRLEARLNSSKLQSLDGGCVYGQSLIAWRTEDRSRHAIDFSQ